MNQSVYLKGGKINKINFWKVSIRIKTNGRIYLSEEGSHDSIFLNIMVPNPERRVQVIFSRQSLIA